MYLVASLHSKSTGVWVFYGGLGLLRGFGSSTGVWVFYGVGKLPPSGSLGSAKHRHGYTVVLMGLIIVAFRLFSRVFYKLQIYFQCKSLDLSIILT